MASMRFPPGRCRAGRTRDPAAAPGGFTLVELLVVLAVVGLLVALATPRYVASLERGREQVLRHDLATMREAIDRFRADRGRLPGELQELVDRGYLRSIPPDPLTGRADSWQPVASPEGAPGVFDVRSGAEGVAASGEPYAGW